jgi:tetratricopeptide (TPR) repeat protein
LADQLVSAESTEAFLRNRPVVSTWETVSALKTEVDRLIGSDLKAARRLSERVDQIAAVIGDPVSKGFADASRARVLHHDGRYAEADSLYRSAIRATRAAKLTTDTAVLQMHRVFALTQMGRYDEALKTARASRRVLSSRSPVHLAQLETNIGILYYRRIVTPRRLSTTSARNSWGPRRRNDAGSCRYQPLACVDGDRPARRGA